MKTLLDGKRRDFVVEKIKMCLLRRKKINLRERERKKKRLCEGEKKRCRL